MIIRKSTLKDLPVQLELFADARRYMAENGNPNQWRNTNPTGEQIRRDISEGKSYVCTASVSELASLGSSEIPKKAGDENDEVIVGTFFFCKGPDPTYFEIRGEWLENESEYCVVHRITTDRNTRGVGTFCLNWAFEQHPNIRIDTHEDNKPMQGLLTKLGFKYCGIIRLENGEDRIAFQKIADR